MCYNEGMDEIIFATRNEGKLREVRQILADTGLTVISMNEAGIDADIIEDGETFADNAIIKARTVMELTGKPALADDSGLAVDYLDGAPGVYSARYMGEDTPYEIKNQRIIELLKDAEPGKRGAQYVCVIAAAFPDGSVFTEEAVMNGVIAERPAGTGGFGYDPILYMPEQECTVAEMMPEQKHAISHRGKALRQMKERLMKRGE